LHQIYKQNHYAILQALNECVLLERIKYGNYEAQMNLPLCTIDTIRYMQKRIGSEITLSLYRTGEF